MCENFRMDINPYKVIVGSENIRKYMGVCSAHFFTKYRRPMEAYGCIWKKDKRRSSPLVSSPILINIFWLLYNKERLYGKGEQYERTKDR